MSKDTKKTVNEEPEDVFAAASSALLGTTNNQPLVARLKDHQIVLASAANPSKELLHTSIKAAYARIADAAVLTRRQLNEIYKQHQVQSQDWFRVSIIAAFIGFLIVLSGVIALLVGYTNTGFVSTAVGVVSEVIAGLFYKQAKAANYQLHSDLLKLIDAERFHQAVELALTIDDPQLRDQLKVSILKLALRDNSIISTADEEKEFPDDSTQ